jgi:hypothetical protein
MFSGMTQIPNVMLYIQKSVSENAGIAVIGV